MSNTDILFTPMLQRLPPALLALGAQLVALLAVTATAVALRESGSGLPSGLPLPLWIALTGLAAALLSRWLGLPTWWQIINLVFIPLLWLTLQSGIDPLWFLAGFALLALTSLGAIRTRVPLYLSSPRAAVALAERLPENARVLDLGCGLGGPLSRLGTLRPDAALDGVEAAPLNWLIARLRLLGRAQVRLGNIWDTDLSGHDVVYAYLSPAPMPRLWQKARAEMRPGSLFISNTFTVPGVEPDEVVELHDLSHARLLIWRMR
ncbi:MAG: class I SAM-dependent methyltransferase [Pseudomonadota bacterium]|nr:class I SAM-dependent methyltransferase [Pseudomonadota bacterium]